MRRVLLPLCAVAAAGLLWPGAAQAHPLGNFSVNQLGALALHPDRVAVAYVADLAELPTLQSPLSCTDVAAAFHVTVDGHAAGWSVDREVLTYADGAAGLRTSRLECDLSAPAALSAGATVTVANDVAADRTGWRELTATADGVHLVDPPLPASSRSDGLRTYPDDLLSSPPSVRSATLRVAPGGSTTGAATHPAGPAALPAPVLPASVLPGWAGRAELTLRGWVAQRELTPWVGLLAVLLALTLGAAHAALPGHGKTVMAAYLAGRQGRPRDALTVGATVTLTHTGGVLLLGLLLTTAAGLAGETVLGWLGVTSGVLVATIGATMLLSRRTTAHAHGPHSHGPHTHGPHSHGPHSHGSHSPGPHLPGPHSPGPHLPGPHTHADHSHDPSGHPHTDHSPGHPHADDHDEHIQSAGHTPGPHIHGDHTRELDNHTHDDHAHADHTQPPRHAHGLHGHPHDDHPHNPDGHTNGDHSPGRPHADDYADGGDHDHTHSHDHLHGGGDHTPSHSGGDRPHGHSHGHDHPHRHDHSHGHGGRDRGRGGGRPGRLAVVGMGVAGGLVPSPSALIVLLGAVALGRTWFGVLLVLAYGIGMAATLTAAGLLLIKVRDRWPARLRLSARLTGLAPTGTAALVLLVGSALAVRSLITL